MQDVRSRYELELNRLRDESRAAESRIIKREALILAAPALLTVALILLSAPAGELHWSGIVLAGLLCSCLMALCSLSSSSVWLWRRERRRLIEAVEGNIYERGLLLDFMLRREARSGTGSFQLIDLNADLLNVGSSQSFSAQLRAFMEAYEVLCSQRGVPAFPDWPEKLSRAHWRRLALRQALVANLIESPPAVSRPGA